MHAPHSDYAQRGLTAATVRRLACQLLHHVVLPRLEQRSADAWLVTRCASCGRELAAYRTVPPV